MIIGGTPAEKRRIPSHFPETAFAFSRQQHLLFSIRLNTCKQPVKHRYACFTAMLGGLCLPTIARTLCPSDISLLSRESPSFTPCRGENLTPNPRKLRLRRIFDILNIFKVNAVAVFTFYFIIEKNQRICYN